MAEAILWKFLFDLPLIVSSSHNWEAPAVDGEEKELRWSPKTEEHTIGALKQATSSD
jgi:hypothetical protein